MIIIGEKINGTRETVGEAIRDRNTELIQDLALAQVNGGADRLDVNAGTLPHEEPHDMAWLVETIQAVTKTRLCLDSPNPEALLSGIESAVRLFMINSVSGERMRVEQVLPIACEHRTDLVLLALNDKGIPETAADRLDIVDRLVSMAREGGLGDEQLFVDPLITTIATNADSGRTALLTIREIKRRFPQVHIICGLSNISFGQPSRTLINQAFAALAMEAGLDSAIMDPADRGLRNIIHGAELVLGADPDCLRYNRAHRSGFIGAPEGLQEMDVAAIAHAFNGLNSALSRAGIVSGPKADSEATDPVDLPEKTGAPDSEAQPLEAQHPETDRQTIEELVSSLIEMKRDRVLELTDNLLDGKTDPMEILGASRRAMGEVGRLFEKEEYFIPELILAGKMLKSIADKVKPHLTADMEGEKKGRVLLGTVAGDIHDIGKDIVAIMLDVNGYEVLDLGVERFVEAARTFKPNVVGLSGFLTLVYEPMKETIKAIRDLSLGEIRFMIGGGQIDEQVKSYTVADGYGRDAIEAVKFCKKWI
jgi:cobalamin-dependent methionine synthase I